jgi:hypothetical protein
MFILFNTPVVRDGINPKAAHAAFLEIDEYRMAISPEIPGAVKTGRVGSNGDGSHSGGVVTPPQRSSFAK